MLIVGGNQSAGGYEVDNSLRFDDGSSDYLNRTFSTPTDNKKWTYSLWVKRTNPGTDNGLLSCGANSNNRGLIYITSSDTLGYFDTDSGTDTTTIVTNRLFRDVSAWYHIVVAVDTTQATSSNRVKVYVNGTQETSLSSSTYPSQNYDGYINSGIRHDISGRNHQSTSDLYFDGYMAEVCFIDGTALDPTSFGEFDEDSGIWKPIDVSGLTFGTNGFYLPFENSADLGQDDSGNGNDFTVNNLTSIDQSTDTPTNNYATMNPLAKSSTGTSTFAQGNLKISTDESQLFGAMSTIGVTQGKWYVECKKISQDSGTADTLSRLSFGVTNKINHSTNNPTTDAGNYYVYGIETVYNGSTDLGNLAGTSHIADGKIQMIALDLDNNQVTFGANGQWMDGSGSYNQTSPSSFVSITDPADTEAGYFFFQGDGSITRGYTGEWNFGGTQTFTISSGNSDANGYGNFEYAPPSGYYALNTKNLAEYG